VLKDIEPETWNHVLGSQRLVAVYLDRLIKSKAEDSGPRIYDTFALCDDVLPIFNAIDQERQTLHALESFQEHPWVTLWNHHHMGQHPQKIWSHDFGLKVDSASFDGVMLELGNWFIQHEQQGFQFDAYWHVLDEWSKMDLSVLLDEGALNASAIRRHAWCEERDKPRVQAGSLNYRDPWIDVFTKLYENPLPEWTTSTSRKVPRI